MSLHHDLGMISMHPLWPASLSNPYCRQQCEFTSYKVAKHGTQTLLYLVATGPLRTCCSGKLPCARNVVINAHMLLQGIELFLASSPRRQAHTIQCAHEPPSAG
eukprot:jgi/Ulvmu1/8388/UM042_0095.1